MKETYTAPQMEIITFHTSDVITASPKSWELPYTGEE